MGWLQGCHPVRHAPGGWLPHWCAPLPSRPVPPALIPLNPKPMLRLQHSFHSSSCMLWGEKSHSTHRWQNLHWIAWHCGPPPEASSIPMWCTLLASYWLSASSAAAGRARGHLCARDRAPDGRRHQVVDHPAGGGRPLRGPPGPPLPRHPHLHHRGAPRQNPGSRTINPNVTH